jgi:hypothetical protein
VIFTRIAWVAGLAVFAGMCWLAVLGFPPAGPLVITAVVLVALVAGGGALRGRSTSRGPGDPGDRAPR